MNPIELALRQRLARCFVGYRKHVTILGTIARSSIAPLFLAGGLDAVRNPESQAAKAEFVAGPLARVFRMTDDPVKLVRINGGIQLAAGTLLILGWAPRLSSMVLAASLVPTTVAGHRFWEETDPVVRAHEKTAFLKNCAIVGGLLLAAVDRNGAPSLRWRTDKAAHRVVARATENLNRASAAMTGKKSKFEMLEAGALSAIGSDNLSHFGKHASTTATHLGHSIAESLSDAANAASHTVAALTSR